MVASAEDKAKVKEALIPYIVGCIVIFGAFTIWSIAVNMGQSITSGGTGGSGGSSSTAVTKKCPHCGRAYTSGMSGGECLGCGNPID